MLVARGAPRLRLAQLSSRCGRATAGGSLRPDNIRERAPQAACARRGVAAMAAKAASVAKDVPQAPPDPILARAARAPRRDAGEPGLPARDP
jgi:hypothetical protein